MKASKLLGSLAFASTVGFSGQVFATAATVTSLGNLNTAPAFDYKLVDVGGLFLPDYFTFSLSKLSNVNVDFNSLAGLSLGSTFGLYDSTGSTLIKSYSMPSVTILGGPELIFAGLSAGSYQFKYNPGLFTASFGTKVSFTAIPVPEPENNALVFAGLALIGLIARRKFV